MIYFNNTVLSGESPFYTEFLSVLQEDNETLGIASCDWENAGTNLNTNKSAIIKYFNDYYALREIGSETTNRWQLLVNRKFEEIKREYELRFALYTEYDFTVLGKTITTESDSEYQDTPVTSLSGDYATNKNHNLTVMTLDTDQKIDELENVFKKFRDLIREFVERFEVCFIDVLGRI